MPVRIRIRNRLLTRTWGRIVLLVVLASLLVGLGVFGYYWQKYSRLIDTRLSGEIFERASQVYAAPRPVFVGETVSPPALAAQLRRFGYAEGDEPPTPYGHFRRTRHRLEIRPGPLSLVGPGEAVGIEWAKGRIQRITGLSGGQRRSVSWIDPAHVTNLFDRRRTKRRLVTYEDIPPELIQAVVAAEDRRFFSHPGISLVDGLRALWYDLGIWAGFRKGVRVHGASTVTMQLARSFFLTRDLSWRRKTAEALIALQLERRFDKEKIFELYANEIYLGQRGSFGIHGLSEATQAYFGKDISQLTLPESAFLGGIIRGPNRYSPFRHPERAQARRDHILGAMVETGAITRERAEAAKKTPLTPAPMSVDASGAPYFVDLVMDQLSDRYTEENLITRGFRIYTTLDPDLQQAAAEAVREALKEVDEKVAKRWEQSGGHPQQVQVCLIALDPHTGAVKALVGGRDYTASQLNHATTHRQPGSAFKPFVYAAAFQTALTNPETAITPITTVVDEPTVFLFEDQEYQPSNYGERFYGVVTLRQALSRSLNVATVKVAEMVGYEHVAELAARAGLNPRLRPTPSIALGAYDSTPLEVIGAYTLFANGGERVEPFLIQQVGTPEGSVLEEHESLLEPVLDPRIAYLVGNLLEETLNRGTGAGARARGFLVPAAGKTGTSRDAWFVGYTSNLLCAVWVGFDDYSDLGLPGAAAAQPIWTEFMKRAVALPAYRDVEPFVPPEGIIMVPIDPDTLQLATPDCPEVRPELFVVGSEPTDLCPKHRRSLVRRVTGTLMRAIGIRRPAPDAQKPAEPPRDSPPHK
ncbi:MAG: penicillin-binding protein 1A [Terriglobia bacterium]